MTEDFFKIIVVIIITAVLSLTIKGYRSEYSFLLVVFTVCVITVTLLYKIFPTLGTVTNIFKRSGVSTGYFSTALKALGISYVASFAADVCRDAGQSALAAKAEFAGKCAIFILALPLVLNILQASLEFAAL